MTTDARSIRPVDGGKGPALNLGLNTVAVRLSTGCPRAVAAAACTHEPRPRLCGVHPALCERRGGDGTVVASSNANNQCVAAMGCVATLLDQLDGALAVGAAEHLGQGFERLLHARRISWSSNVFSSSASTPVRMSSISDKFFA